MFPPQQETNDRRHYHVQVANEVPFWNAPYNLDRKLYKVFSARYQLTLDSGEY